MSIDTVIAVGVVATVAVLTLAFALGFTLMMALDVALG